MEPREFLSRPDVDIVYSLGCAEFFPLDSADQPG